MRTAAGKSTGIAHFQQFRTYQKSSSGTAKTFRYWDSGSVIVAGSGTILMMASGPTSKVEYDQRWHDAWQIGVAPGQKWDIGRSAPAFVEFLDSGFLNVHGKTAYVPGCGRGYDVVELARRGARATGLDLAPESTHEAKKYLQQTGLTSLSGSAQFVSGDFFVFRTDQPWVEVGYDYTFLCALHPTMRGDWARTWGKLIKTGGCLVTLEFPIRPDDKTGPPWPVSHQIYTDLLAPLGFQNVYYKEIEASDILAKVPGAQVLSCWQKM